MGIVKASGRAYGWDGRDLGQGSRVDLRFFFSSAMIHIY